jgi:DNA-binding winged helix-turn-helix (wHTH) protein/tetratricopeptide (TPR) repeat protein
MRAPAAELRYFSPFRLDSKNEQLWRGAEEIRLRRKTFAVLRHLVEHPAELVTKAALLDAVWPDVSVSDSMPAISVRELRKALGDSADAPRFIETVQGRGYRFIARVTLQSIEVPSPSSSRPPPAQVRSAQNTFIGRDRERAQLRLALDDAISGQGSICLISGEPGIGKTRVCAELATDAHGKGAAVLVGHCAEQEGLPYLPFVELLEGFIEQTSSLETLRRALGDDAPELARLLPKLRRLLPDLPPPMALEPQQARWHLFNSFYGFIARLNCENPTLLILEDLHWADDSTLELLTHLSQRTSGLRLMLIATYRESEVAAHPSLSRALEDLVRGRLATRILLEGLPPDEVALMLKELSGRTPPSSVVGKIYSETEGNPFFVEEVFRYLDEEKRLFDSTGNFRAQLEIVELDVPDNVRLVVGRRLTRLSEATLKTLATAAVIGRCFTFELLEASTHAHTEELLDNLDETESVYLVRSRTAHGEGQSEFSHELVRQVVLSQLSAPRRQRLHLEVAEAIEKLFSATLEDHYAELAHHYAQTTNARKAIHYIHLACHQCAHRGSYAEAVALFERGVELLIKLRNEDERAEAELELRLGVQFALGGVKGQGSPEALASAQRAVELSRRPGVHWEKTFTALEGIWNVNLFRDVQMVCEIAPQLVTLAEKYGDLRHLALALHCLGWARVETGDFQGADEILLRAINVSKSIPLASGDKARLILISNNIGLSSFNKWCLGYPGQALQELAEATALALESGSKPTLRIRYSGGAFLHQLRRELDLMRANVEANLALTNELNDQTHIGQSEILLGWIEAESGDLEGGLARMQRHVSVYRAAGAEWAAQYFLALIASVLGRAGQTEEGLRIFEDALEIMEKTGERFFEAEVHRLRGELLRPQSLSSVEPAEAEFRTAVAIARKQHGKSWELRATTSLTQLMRDTGRGAEARTMLAEIYNWFTEGFDTADLKDAKALLDELSI